MALTIGSLSAVSASSLLAETYSYDGLVPDWFSGPNAFEAIAAGGTLKVAFPPNNQVLVNGVGSLQEFPKPNREDWAGVEWKAPKGEVISQIKVKGGFRRETTERLDFRVALFGGSDAGFKAEPLEVFTGESNSEGAVYSYDERAQKVRYEWAVTIKPTEAISKIQLRAWEAVEGGVAIQGGSDAQGYSGSVTSVEIVTERAPGVAVANKKADAALVKAIELGNEKVRLRISEAGTLLSITDLVTGTELLAKSTDQPAWQIAWRGHRGGNEISISEGFSLEENATPKVMEGEGTIDSARYGRPKLLREPNKLTFMWEKENLPTVKGTIVFNEQAGQFLFTADVTNASSAIVERISFPSALLFEAASDNYTLLSADNNYSSAIKPLDALKPFTTMYPGYMFMQMAGFKIGNSSLLVYTNDDKAHVKWMHYSKESGHIRFDLAQQVRLKPKKEWHSPYSVVMKVIPKGSYHEMAQAYGEWGRKQWWAKEKLADKVAKRPSLKNYFEGGLCRLTAGPPVCDSSSFKQTEDTRWQYIEGGEYAKFEPYYQNVVDTITAFEKAYGVKPGYWFPVWSGHQFDSIYPDYFPIQKQMGDFEHFKKALVEHRYPMIYHMNIAQWAETAPTAQNKRFLALTDKETHYRVFFGWSKMWSVLTSPAIALEKEIQTVEKIADQAGYNGVYLDVIGHSFATDENPESPFHGEPNDYQLQKMEVFKKVRGAMAGPLMTEARNEIELAYMDMGTGANGGPESDEIPLWEMVYGDCAATTTYHIADKQLRYFTWSLGGVMAQSWDWPTPSGSIPAIYLTGAQQKIISGVIGERMERFDKIGENRLSNWKSGIVLWNRAKAGDKATLQQATTLGTLDVEAFCPGGVVMWNQAGDFAVDSAASVSWNGKLAYRCDKPEGLSVNRNGRRWVIHNEGSNLVDATISVLPEALELATMTGKAVVSGTPVKAEPVMEGGMHVFKVSVPAGECLVFDPDATRGAVVASTQEHGK